MKRPRDWLDQRPGRRGETSSGGVGEGLRGRRELLLYLLVGAAYVGLGVAFQEILLSYFVGVAFLLLGVWLLPAVYRRLRR